MTTLPTHLGRRSLAALATAVLQGWVMVLCLAAVLSQINKLELPGLFSDVEPYKTFSNFYRQHPVLPMRLVGVLLALIYRTEEARGH